MEKILLLISIQSKREKTASAKREHVVAPWNGDCDEQRKKN